MSVASPSTVFGFATGNTPLNIYKELSKAGQLQCAAAFSLDEYVGLNPGDSRSFAWYIRNRVEPALKMSPGFVNVPAGEAKDIDEECARFEGLIHSKPIDLQLLGTGRNGHIAFNEPGSRSDSITRKVELAESTRNDNGSDFEGLAPHWAITQGIATIMRAKRILVVATGVAKREPIAKLLAGQVDENWPITHLIDHPDLVVLVDQAAMD